MVLAQLEEPIEPEYAIGESRSVYRENRNLKREHKSDQDTYNQKLGLAASLIRSTVSTAAETFIKSLTDPVRMMWTALKTKCSPENNPALQ